MTTHDPRAPIPEAPAGRDELDLRVTEKLRALRLSRPVPAPSADEPSDEELLLYLEGALAPAARAATEERIAASPYASARVAIVVDALRECGFPIPPKVATSLGEPGRAIRYVFHLAKDALTFLRGSELPVALGPALAVRGATLPPRNDFYELHHDFGTLSARLQIERVPERGLALQLSLQEDTRPVDGARITLKRLGPGEPAGRTLDSAATEDGRASFHDLQPARYQLEIRRAGVEVGQLRVDVLQE